MSFIPQMEPNFGKEETDTVTEYMKNGSLVMSCEWI